MPVGVCEPGEIHSVCLHRVLVLSAMPPRSLDMGRIMAGLAVAVLLLLTGLFGIVPRLAAARLPPSGLTVGGLLITGAIGVLELEVVRTWLAGRRAANRREE